MTKSIVRKYLSISDIQKEYLPISKKKLREFAKKNTSVKNIGGRMYVERTDLERAFSMCGESSSQVG